MNLEKIANRIPCMVNQETKNLLRHYASLIKLNTAIVEVGVWLGACTAQIALGLKDSCKTNTIYAYDRFKANASEVKKALWQQVILYEGENTRYMFKGYMEYFDIYCQINKGNILKAKYKGDKIGLFIDDLSKNKEKFDYIVKTFFKYFIPNETILFLMDHYYFEKTFNPSHKYQYYWMQKHEKEFELIKRVFNCSVAIYKYKGKSKKKYWIPAKKAMNKLEFVLAKEGC